MASLRCEAMIRELEELFTQEAEKEKPDRVALRDLLVRLLAVNMAGASQLQPAQLLKFVEVFAKQLGGAPEQATPMDTFNAWLDDQRKKPLKAVP